LAGFTRVRSGASRRSEETDFRTQPLPAWIRSDASGVWLALLGYLADWLNLRPGALHLVAGAASRDKSVLIDCNPAEASRIAQRLAAGFSR
jgi:hypothetical protein